MSNLKTFISKESFKLDSGNELNSLTVAYHTYGELNLDKSNVVWVFHAISANSDVMDWWPKLFAEKGLFNPNEHFIVCANVIGSPYGSSSPKDLTFPQFNVRDVVRVHQQLASHLKIEHISLAIGGSFGGAQALEFAYSFKGKIDNLVLLACSASESAWGIAVHESQRLALKSDPTFGEKDGGEAGMKAARSVAMLTYRTVDAFVEGQTDSDEKEDGFKASSYIQYQGDKFVKRFNALCYYYLTKCLDTHNIGRGRGGESKALQDIKIPTLVIGIKSDNLVPVRFQKFIAENMPNAKYEEIESDFGHDGFLVEHEKIAVKIKQFLNRDRDNVGVAQRKVLKFGGKSLANGSALKNTLKIINEEHEKGPIALVLSARGETTDRLVDLYELAKASKDFSSALSDLEAYQKNVDCDVRIDDIIKELKEVLSAVLLLKADDEFAFDRVVSYGELLSSITVSKLLEISGVKSISVDSRKLIFTKPVLDDFEVDIVKSKEQTLSYFNQLPIEVTPVITGYIATSEKGRTVTLGRNGSNYTATLIASFINAKEVQNWTDVDGVYSASPKYVPDAIRIDSMSYKEANELANFGTNVLHPKTILPLMQSDIPLRIKSSSNPYSKGTLINKQGAIKGIKAVSIIEDVALVSIQGRGLIGSIGIDGRIFTSLSKKNISVRLISQASSERGIGFVINKVDAEKAGLLLQKEFEEELSSQQISSITINKDVAVVAIVGRHNYSLEKAIRGLRKNKIWLHLISNSISGEHISLVVDNKRVKKAVRVVHNEVFGAIKTINVFAFGKGTVGGALLNQILTTSKDLTSERGLRIRIIGVADSTSYIFNETGVDENWRSELSNSVLQNNIPTILESLKESGIENIVVVDNTSSEELTSYYPAIVRNGFDIVAANKKANSSSYVFYENLRKQLKRSGRLFYYETNVGAGLPIIDTIKHLYQSSDNITKIRGVFSGSLSYLFNNFSVQDVPFSKVLLEAREKGFTEPDPREDLCGMDVARKLVILAREAGFKPAYEDVVIENLIPASLQQLGSYEDFVQNLDVLDSHYSTLKQSLGKNEVLRYVGDFDASSSSLKVSLIKVDASSPLGGIKNADSIFELYTEGYGDQPIIVQGAGAGAEVTARGVYSDLLKIGSQL